jgi:hypothetical protein
MRRSFFIAVAIGAVVAVPGTVGAASPRSVVGTDTFANDICGVTGVTTVRFTDVFRETREGTFVGTGTFQAVFTADETGKSLTSRSAGPATTLSEVVDETAGTITFVQVFRGLPEKVAITGGPTLTRDAGNVTLTSTFALDPETGEPTGDPLSQDIGSERGPHPDLDSGFELFCEVVEPYLLDP